MVCNVSLFPCHWRRSRCRRRWKLTTRAKARWRSQVVQVCEMGMIPMDIHWFVVFFGYSFGECWAEACKKLEEVTVLVSWVLLWLFCYLTWEIPLTGTLQIEFVSQSFQAFEAYSLDGLLSTGRWVARSKFIAAAPLSISIVGWRKPVALVGIRWIFAFPLHNRLAWCAPG